MGNEVGNKIGTRLRIKFEAVERKLGLVILTIFLVLIVIFVLIPLVLPLLCYRYIAKILASWFCLDLDKMVTTRGSYFTNLDPIYIEPKMNVLSTLVLKGHLSLDKALDAFNRCWIHKVRQDGSGELEIPELQQYPTLRFGFYFWKWDKNVQAENHIKVYNWRHSYAKLDPETIVSVNNELLTKAFAPNQSPWDIHLLHTLSENEDVETLTYLIFRTHHSLGDGKALLKLISDCCYTSGDTFINRINPKPAKQCNETYNSFESATAALRKLSGMTLVAPYSFVKNAFQVQDDNRLIMESKDFSWKLNAAVTTDVSVQLIKKIKNSYNVSFTSVIFAGVTGAIRKFMLENSISVPDVVHSITPFPIPGHSYKLRNYSSFGTLKLPVGLPNAESRLRFIENAFIHLKNSPVPLLSFYLMSLIGSLPASIGRALAWESPISAHVSNIAGPTQPVDIFGHELKSFWFSPANIGLGVTCLSYSDNLNLVVSIDKNIFPLEVSIQSIRNKILEEFKILSETPPIPSS